MSICELERETIQSLRLRSKKKRETHTRISEKRKPSVDILELMSCYSLVATLAQTYI